MVDHAAACSSKKNIFWSAHQPKHAWSVACAIAILLPVTKNLNPLAKLANKIFLIYLMFSYGIRQNYRSNWRPLNSGLEKIDWNDFNLEWSQLFKHVQNLKVKHTLANGPPYRKPTDTILRWPITDQALTHPYARVYCTKYSTSVAVIKHDWKVLFIIIIIILS